MHEMRNRSALQFGLQLTVILVLLVFPLGAERWFNAYYLDLVARILIVWIALLGFALLAGYGGLVSFGHAMFFGFGAYTAAGVLMHVQALTLLPLSLLVGVAASGLGAVLIGYLCIRTQGVYFILLTLAFAELGYTLVFNAVSITGGSNGLYGIPKGAIAVGEAIHIDWLDPSHAYYLALGCFAVSYLIARWIKRSAFGAALVAVRDNESRAAYLGFDVAAIKRRVFTISAMFAGFSGALWAHHQSYVSPELLHWSFSGQFIIMTWLGGVGTLVGPLIGGALIMSLSDILSSLLPNWLIFFGVLYIAVVLWAPRGLWGLASRLWAGSK